MMVGFGCSLDVEKFKEHIKKPKGIIIGFLSQYLIMPFICWCLTVVGDLEDHYSVALILIGCCPGGALSNMVCYIFRMDIELSIAMTTCSSIAAIAMMPLNTYIYVKVVNDVSFVFDWWGLIISCLVVVCGTITGLMINVKFVEYTLKFERLARIMMVIIIIGSFVNNSLSNVPLWRYKPSYIYAMIITPAIAGSFIGFTASYLLKLPKPSCIAVANETGFQNAVLAIAIITLTYKFRIIHVTRR